MKHSLCDGWTFFEGWPCQGPGVPVRLPHTVREVPLHGASPRDYEGVYGYRRTLTVPPELAGKRLFLQLDGAAHQAEVYVNGKEAGSHKGGYTAFRAELTGLVRQGENVLEIKLDAHENPALPPFGFVIDYLTYGGLYREAWLDVREESFVSDVFVSTPDLTTAKIQITLDTPGQGQRVTAEVLEGDSVLASVGAAADGVLSLTLPVPGARPWAPDGPALYTCRVTLLAPDGAALDRVDTLFGFRTAEWKGDSFYLNGKKVFLRGLDRHQCWPWLGYAAPASLQREDARILKEELGCNTVRTSHYPQSHHFLDACDRLGLLVFTELPGWQHVGDGPWQDLACEAVREMVLQYRNHPSIILWGVRINESLDYDDFYERTNAIAHELDPTRATSGVRNFEKSHLLEDVYSYNDFSYHQGDKPPAVKSKKAVTPDPGKPLIISEHSGHMYPTKSYDDWPHRAAHALRHAQILNDAMADGGHAGCIGWCMFDYPTHQDFGAGDRVCYHGVLDVFRNPKPAAGFYASQQDARPVLEVLSNMDPGDYPAAQLGTVAVFTNLPQVALYKNGQFVTRLSRSGLSALPHQPLLLDDMVGELLESQEGYPPGKAQLIRDCLAAAGRYGMAALPLRYKLKLGWCMLRYRLSYADGVALYGKYIGGWGDSATQWRFDGLDAAGNTVLSVTRAPSSDYHLEVTVSHTHLREGDSYDMAAVRVRIADAFGAAASYLQLPVTFTLTGDALLASPPLVTAEGGMCGGYVKTAGRAGSATLTVSTPQTPPVTVRFTITK